MNNPIICEVLGVEREERFKYLDFDIWLDANGLLHTKDGYASGNLVCDIINHPDRIIRKPRWTEQEVETARQILSLYGGDQEYLVLVRDEKGRLFLKNLKGLPDEWDILEIKSALFPSIKPDCFFYISEITGGHANEHQNPSGR